jgi:hypothetical protein
VIENAKIASLNEIIYSTFISFRFIVEHSSVEYYILKRLLKNSKSLDIRIKALRQILDKNIDDYDNQPIFTRSPNKILKDIDST